MKHCCRPSLSGVAALLIGTSCVVACATSAPPSTEPLVKDTAWLIASIDQPLGDPGRECTDSALRTSFALIALRAGSTSDEIIRDALLSGAKEPDLRDQRTHEYDVWQRSHDVSVVAADHLAWCLSRFGVVLEGPDVLPGCLAATEPVAMLSMSRHHGDTKAQAIEQATAGYQNQVTDELVRYSGLIYDAPTKDEELVIRASSFKNCLRLDSPSSSN